MCLLAGVHLEVFGAADEGECQMRPLGVEHVPDLLEQKLDLTHWSRVAQSDVPVKKKKQIRRPNVWPYRDSGSDISSGDSFKSF